MRLPHSVHLHCNNLGMPGNWRTTLETMKTFGDSRGHLSHIQFHSYGGGEGDETTFNSKVAELVEYVDAHPNLTVDVGQVLFGETTTMTADGPLGYYLSNAFKSKWFSSDTEMESGCGIAPIEYKNTSLVHSLQWAIGLEWYLLAKDPWRVVMSTDHPNGGSFLAYPQIIQLLMDRTYRAGHAQAACTRRSWNVRTLGDLTQGVQPVRDLHHHAQRPGEDSGSEEQGPSGPGRRRRHHHLHAERRQDEDVRAAASGHQERRRHRRPGRDSRTAHREAAVRGAGVRRRHRDRHRRLVREVLLDPIPQLPGAARLPARPRGSRVCAAQPDDAACLHSATKGTPRSRSKSRA